MTHMLLRREKNQTFGLSGCYKVVLLRSITFHSFCIAIHPSVLRVTFNSMETSVVNPNYQPGSVYYTSPGQFQHLQGQVDDVTEIMRNNIRLGLERGANLDDLEIKAEDLNNSSNQFALNSHRVRQKFWWKNVQMWIIIGIIVIIIIVIIIVLSVLAAQKKI